MHLDALDPGDIIETFTDTDELVPGVVTKTTFVSFGPIQRTYLGRDVTALTVKLRSLTGPGGPREFFEVTHSPIANFDLHALADAAERARRFVGDARCIDFSTMFHSDWEAVAREVATKPEPLVAMVGEFERGPLSVGVVASGPCSVAHGLAANQVRLAQEYVELDALENACWIEGALATCTESSPCA